MSNMWVIAVLAALLLGLAMWMWGYGRFARQSSSIGDRYTPEPLLEPEQIEMLNYLRQTFPGQVVLPNVNLSTMLSVRRAADPQRAEKELKEHTVDFVACADDGRPAFAFDIQRYHLSNAAAHEETLKVKNRILRAGGVRLVSLKNTTGRMPAPDEFRAQLSLAARQRPKDEPQQRPDPRRRLEEELSQFDNKYPASEFSDSEVLGLSGLMGLYDEVSKPLPTARPPSNLRGQLR
jgi:Protein of unknown function (DUF2726)